MLYFVSPWYAKGAGPKFFREGSERKPQPSKPWRRPCQGKTVKVKFMYNRLTGEK